MARKKVNKAEQIRQVLGTMGVDAAPKDVIAALAAKKITVSAAQVSNIKTSLRGGTGSKQGRGRGAKNGSLSVSDLLAAKKLAGEIGLEKAREAIEALAKLTN